MFAHNRTFFEGLKRNASIENIGLSGWDFSEGIGREFLNEYVANNNNLISIISIGSFLGNGGIGVLTSAVTRCPNLNIMYLKSCNIDDGMLEELVSGIRGANQIRKLDLNGNNFGRDGCEALMQSCCKIPIAI